MAGTKISNLPAATTPLNGTEIVPVVQSDVTSRTTIAQINTVVANGTTTPRVLSDRFADAISIKDFNAVGDGLTNNRGAFETADALSANIQVPEGTYVCRGYIPTGFYFGDGSIKLENVTNGNGESLAFTYALDKSVPTRISQNVLNYNSGALFEQDYNVYVGQSCAPNTKLTDGMVVAVGGMALNNSGSGVNSSYRVTAVGAHALRRAVDPFSVTAIGDSACENGADLSRIVAVGSNAAQFSGDTNPVAHFHEFFTETDPYGLATRNDGFRAYVGTSSSPNYLPTSSDNAKESVAVGRNALLHNVRCDNDVAVGYNALAHGYNTASNTAVGSSALRDGVSAVSNVAVGRSAGLQTQTAEGNVIVGADAFYSNVHTQFNTVLGYRAAYSLSGDSTNQTTARSNARQNVAIGAFSMENAVKGVNNTAVGNAALKALNGADQNAAIGATAGELLQTGSSNTFLGYAAGRLNGDGTDATARTNCTYVGFNTRVTGDNQVQLGDSGTTTYAWGAVQNRSDARDKADVKDTGLGLAFIEKLRPVDYRWDYRDDYILVDEDGNVTEQLKDGNKKRLRFHHGLIAQEVKAACDELGIDFGGYQDHAINGGCDVKSIGYTELIAPLIKAVQELSARVKELEGN